MQPAVHLHPDRLRAHSVATTELVEMLQAVLARRPLADTPARGPDGGLSDLDASLRRAACELAELGAVLAAAASAAETADSDAARAVHRAGWS